MLLSRDDPTSRELDYTITVTNDGPGVAEDVVVTDDLDVDVAFDDSVMIDGVAADPTAFAYDSGTHSLTVDLGDLASGASKTITFQVLVAWTPTDQDFWMASGGDGTAAWPADTSACDVNNFVAVDSTTDDPDADDNTWWEPTGVDMSGIVPFIKIDKTTQGWNDVFGDGVEVRTGEEVMWRYVVEIDTEFSNPGELSLYNIVVTDDQGVTPGTCRVTPTLTARWARTRSGRSKPLARPPRVSTRTSGPPEAATIRTRSLLTRPTPTRPATPAAPRALSIVRRRPGLGRHLRRRRRGPHRPTGGLALHRPDRHR